MRLHVLYRQGKLLSAEAQSSHVAVCAQLRRACQQAGRPQAFHLLCENDRVRLAPVEPANALAGGARSASDGSALEAQKPALAKSDPPVTMRAYYGEQLHNAAARQKLERDRYVVLRGCARRHCVGMRSWFAG